MAGSRSVVGAAAYQAGYARGVADARLADFAAGPPGKAPDGGPPG
jgi:hypothetical protein